MRPPIFKMLPCTVLLPDSGASHLRLSDADSPGNKGQASRWEPEAKAPENVPTLCERGSDFPGRRHDAGAGVENTSTVLARKPGDRQAMTASMGLPWSISRRLRPGISSRRESRPSWRRIVAWMSVT